MSEDIQDLEAKRDELRAKLEATSAELEAMAPPTENRYTARKTTLAEANRQAVLQRRLEISRSDATEAAMMRDLEKAQRDMGAALSASKVEAEAIIKAAREEAQALIEQAREQAREVRSAANAEADSIVQAGRASAAVEQGREIPPGTPKPAKKQAKNG